MKLKQISNFVEPIFEKVFGFADDTKTAGLFTLQNAKGLRLRITDYGATVASLEVPLKSGELVDVVCGFDSVEDYIASYALPSAPYFGTTIGRYAGRIAGGRFSLNGRQIVLNANNGSNTLHGGITGFGQKIWEVRRRSPGNNPSITFGLTSPDGDEHFPGELTIELTYTLTDENEVILEYKAITNRDTVVNLTHHSYFNLDGHDRSVLGQQLSVNANKILEVDPENIPTGQFVDLDGHAFDFSSAKDVPESIDNTFVLDSDYGLAATLFSPKNQLKMSVFTNQPGVHIYVGGNCFGKLEGKKGANYHASSGICFETQNYPDAPNHKHFPSATLEKDSIYHHKTIYKFQSY
ncbi:aldose epimerase family protein [Flavobacterium selenitireducens]|uniref:aldose epimerase family protein n=1 Tax=Flavobacterium selenitireducens TaxID=2722704 RepID=UPI00168A4F44|nr:aldose epimerase family protein [Flavobacterium selenitireducens]MBD3581825.1 galactose mutarotase [Flavobacterium selenitireducens]